MKKPFFWIAAAALAQAVLAQDLDNAVAQRERIAAERGQVETRFRTQEKDCYGRFAVNDCLNAAKARRREAMADLRRQEISLNDAERKRKGAERQRLIEERQREIEDRSATEKKQPKGTNSAKAPPAPRSRDAKTQQQAADHGQAEAANAEKARARQRETQQRKDEKDAARRRRSEDAARNVKRREELQAQAEEHKASVNKRRAERKKPPAQPLPAPP